MSSVLLPWKEEPQSPLAFDEATLVDNATFYQSPFDQYDIKLDSDLSACESKAEIASHILENLENLMDLDDLIKDESFLLDEKILPTILEDVEPPRAVPVSIQNLKSEYTTTTNDVHQYYYKDFDTTLYEDVVDFGHGGIKPPQGTLTPPQSPPSQQQQQPLLTTLEPLLSYPSTLPNNDDRSVVVYAAAAEEKQFLHNYSIGNDIEELSFPAVVTPQPDDIAHELAVVEELVRSRVEKMQWSSNNSSSICSSPDSRTSSSSSNFEDGFSDDPEWIPESIHNESAAGEKKPSSRKRSHSKYSKGPPEEKKVRKKEQNKNAATRYRMKKKAQVEEILSEEKILLDHRQELDGKVVDLEREIRYLKGLMRDLFKAKGLIN